MLVFTEDNLICYNSKTGLYAFRFFYWGQTVTFVFFVCFFHIFTSIREIVRGSTVFSFHTLQRRGTQLSVKSQEYIYIYILIACKRNSQNLMLILSREAVQSHLVAKNDFAAQNETAPKQICKCCFKIWTSILKLVLVPGPLYFVIQYPKPESYMGNAPRPQLIPVKTDTIASQN